MTRRAVLAAVAIGALLGASAPTHAARRAFTVGPRTPSGLVTASVPDRLSAAAFRTPPMWARPQAYWLFDRGTTLDEAKAQLRSFKRNGLGGVTIEPGGIWDGVDAAGPHVPGPGWPYPYLSDEWFTFLDGVLTEAERLGMTAYLLDVPFTMSGSAKGKVAEPWQGGDPSLGWTTLREVVPGFVYVPVTAPFWIDPLNPKAVDETIALNHAKHLDKVGKHFGKGLQAMWSDEAGMQPTLSVGTFGLGPELKQIPWSPTFPAYFEKLKGYELTPELLQYVYAPQPSDPRARRVSFDFWDAVSKRFAETYYGRLSSWATKHGLGFIGQLLGEERVDAHFFVEGTYFRPAAQPTIVSTDLLDHASTDMTGTPWCNNDGCYGTTQKLASSAAHLFGRDRVHLEAYDLAHPELKQRPQMLKALIDHSITRGVNHIAFHAYDFNGGGFGPDNVLFDRQRLWTDYTARLQYLVTGGRFMSEVAVGYSPDAFWTGDAVDPETYAITAAALGSTDYQYDHVPLALLRDARVDGGVIRYGTQSYRALVVPDWSTVSLDVMKRIATFVRGGGTLVAVGRKPSRESRGSDAALARLVEQVFGPRYGRGHAIFVPGDFGGALKGIAPSRASELDPMVTALRRELPPRVRVTGSPRLPNGFDAVEVLALKRAGRDTYVVSNFPRWADKPPGHIGGFDHDFPGQHALVTIDVPATGVPYLWDAERGTVARISEYAVIDGRLRIPLDLPAFGSAAIRLHEGDPRTTPHFAPSELDDVAERGGRVSGYRTIAERSIDPVFTVAFDDGTTQRRHAGSWAEPEALTGAEGRGWFVGSATYGARIDLPTPERGERLLLDLGRVGDIADVRVNGKRVGTRAWPDYAFDVTKAVGAGPDRLEIKVTVSQAAALPNDVRYPAGLLGPLRVVTQRLD